MAAIGQQVTISTSATLVFSLVDGETYRQQGYTRADNPNIFLTGTDNDPLPILVVLPPSTDIWFGGSDVTSSGADVGADLSGVPSFAYNAIGGDSLYAVVNSPTSLQLLVLRQ